MELTKKADAGAAGAVDRDYGLRPDLEIIPHPNHARIDGTGSECAIAEIVGDGSGELCLDDRNQVIDEIRQLVIANLRFQIRHTVLNRSAIDQHLWNRSTFHD